VTENSTLDLAIQSIQAAMTPAVLFTASGLLLAGLQNKYSTLIQAVRTLNDERRQLLQRPGVADWEQNRLHSIGRQIPHLLARAKLVRNAVFTLYLGTLLFLMSSFIIGLAHLGWPVMAAMVVGLFGAGLIGLIVGIFFALAEARLSYRVVQWEVGIES
jgi:hypothetical protein